MKKLLLLSFAAFSTAVFAQSSLQVTLVEQTKILSPNEVVNATTTSETNIKFNLDIKNTSNSTKSYKAVRYDVRLNGDAIAYYCFAGTCYGADIITSPTPITLNAGQSASNLSGQYNVLTADLDEEAIVGFSHVKYSFINTADANDSIQVAFKYNIALETVGIKENAKALSAFEIFPNPAKENTSLKINSAKAFESTLVVYNTIGQPVYQKQISVAEGKNKIDMDLQNLRAGVYFVSVRSGEATISKKLIVE